MAARVGAGHVLADGHDAASCAVCTPAVSPSGPSYDAGRRRRAKRSGREMGCWTYVPAEALARAGYVPGGELPYCRVAGVKRGSVVVQLYRKA